MSEYSVVELAIVVVALSGLAGMVLLLPVLAWTDHRARGRRDEPEVYR